MRPVRAAILAVGAAALVVGCGGTPATSVAVTLRDVAIEPVPAEAPAGPVRFTVQNAGAAVHELEVFRVPPGVDGNALPLDDHMADTEALEIVDEVEEIAPSTGATLSATLPSGTYVLICNIAGHYEAGMHSTFTVH